MRLIYLLLGSVTVSVSLESATDVLNLCMQYLIPYTDFRVEGDCVCLTFRLRGYGKLKREAEARGIVFSVVRHHGLPHLLSRYRYRFGIVVGGILALALIFLAHNVVWDVRVTGNERVTSSAVIETLKEYGFGVGSYIPSVNTDKLENRILIDSGEISWISVNIIGTVAEVQIREVEGDKKEKDEIRPANLVAQKAGVIEEVRIFRGKVMVGAGQYVEKGDLLVSGLYDSKQQGFRYTRAAGQVLARTTSEFFIEIPYEYNAICYLEEEYYDKY